MGETARERGRRRGQGELEATVLTALHAAPGPVTAAWVRERLGGGLAYTTVVTILTRLLAKRAVTREKAGRSFVWTPAADAAGLAAHRMRQVLDNQSDRGTVLTRFVTGLTDDDEQLLRSLLTQTGEGGRDGGHDRAPHPATGTGSRTGSGTGTEAPGDDAEGKSD
ncbi:BlaI/MecI/CopY family transcriptional regulator [Streptomyces reniochalinae]|uniref:BlaI/MecI/CopY family transcriptional regulator n=1 Tax=Streptomyces reniochalinae TaxID=2250578 RepID=A0A367F7V9_9ACTN|nr:BlaI/MecI/CopY family transcriptional regulator [Streptomyces reniochalinae]RCG25805.1 BlaI/MecI/CopY family transcriptional regulator [Streptomyces reniochalinae]